MKTYVNPYEPPGFAGVLLVVLMALSPSVLAAPEDVSPVYEEMWANEIIDLREQLIKEDVLSEREVVMLKNDATPIPLDVALPILKTRKPDVKWSLAFANESHFSGILFSEFKDKTRALKELSTPTFRGVLILYADQEVNESEFYAELERLDLNLFSKLSLRELEVVKDEKGRQIIHLDLAHHYNRIYEHFVREKSMNPVEARPLTDQAIAAFRKTSQIKFFIIKK